MRARLVFLWCAVAALTLGLLSAPLAAARTPRPAQPAGQSGALTWQAAQRTDPSRGATSISCVSSTLCRAGDESDLVLRWNGHQWKKGFRFPADAAGIDSISCTSKDFCAAVEDVKTSDGPAYRPVTRNADGTWDLSAATVPFTRTRADSIPGELSCTSASFCMLVDQQQGYQRWDGTSWTAPVTFQKENNTTFVSCASPTMCTAVGDADLTNRAQKGKTVYTWDGSSWSDPHFVVVHQHVSNLSCPTTAFCMLTLGPEYLTLHGSKVSAPKQLPNGPAFGGLSCTSASFCIGTNGGKKGSVRWDGSTWHGPHKLQGQTYLLASCASPSFCAAVSSQGDAVNLVDGTWQAPIAVEHPFGSPQDVSCGSPQLCVLVDGNSAAFGYDGTTWSGPHRITPHSDRKVISCAGAAFCAAGTAGGAVQFRRDGHWSAPQRAVTGQYTGIDAISCTSSTFCAIRTSYGTFRVWNGSHWSTIGTPTDQSFQSALSCVAGGCVLLAVSTRDTNDAQTYVYRTGAKKLEKVGPTTRPSPALSCVSLTFCMSSGVTTDPTSTESSAQQFDGTSWRAAPTAGGDVAGPDVSCASTTFCVLVGGRSESTWDGTQWSAEQQIIDSPIGLYDHLYAVSCRPTLCAATTTYGVTVVAK